MAAGWIDEAKSAPLPRILGDLGLEVRRRAFGPCPACGSTRRGSRDGRPPVGLTRDGQGWRCFRCGAGGDGPDLVALALAGRRLGELSGDRRDEIRAWYAGHTSLLEAPARSRAHRPPAPHLQPVPAPEEAALPVDEVRGLWESCQPVLDDEEVSAWLRSRGVDPARIEDLDLARALPEGARVPPWARRGRPWPALGYRCLLPVFDSRGCLAGLRARAVVPGTEPKGVAPAGPGTASGMVLADPLGELLLGLGAPPEGWPEGQPVRVVVVEGETDFLGATLAWSDREGGDDACAVLGVVAGSWTPEIAERIPDGARVVVWTDPDAAGDRYAEAVRATLEGRCAVYRWRRDDGKDLSDRLREGSLPGDPFEGASPMLSPDRLEMLAELDRRAPTLAAAYDAARLARDLARDLVSLARLPGWPGAPPAGHGWGDELDHLLGGGICPGYLLAVGAATAGAGKTAWAMQIADGLALRSAELVRTGRPGPLTPVLLLTEMPADALSWRTLARWTGADSRLFRAGRSASRLLDRPEGAEEVNRAAEAALEALEGILGQARAFQRIVDDLGEDAMGPALVRRLDLLVWAWRQSLEAVHPGRAVWPVVVFDPIQRWQDPGKGEVEALNELVEELGRAARREPGWIGLLTSDTNKPAATRQGDPPGDQEEGAAAFRGSYKLLHLVDAALYLRRPREALINDDRALLEALVIKNRWGSSLPTPRARALYRWSVRNGRFEPEPVSPVPPTGRGGRRRKA